MNIKVSLLGYQLNLLNTKWNETQFATESRLKEEPNSVEEIHFTLEHLFYESKNYLCFSFAERFICFVRKIWR
jgi:hypothetical protein